MSVPPATTSSPTVTLSGAPASTVATTRSATSRPASRPRRRSGRPLGVVRLDVADRIELDDDLDVRLGDRHAARRLHGRCRRRAVEPGPERRRAAICGSGKTTSAVTFAATRARSTGSRSTRAAAPRAACRSTSLRRATTSSQPHADRRRRSHDHEPACGGRGGGDRRAGARVRAGGGIGLVCVDGACHEPATFDTCSAQFDTRLAVYTGTAIGSLTTVAENDDSDACGPAPRTRARLQRRGGHGVHPRGRSRAERQRGVLRVERHGGRTRRRSRRCLRTADRAPPRAPTSRSPAASRTRRSRACSTCSPGGLHQPYHLSGLIEGPHVLRVFATDAAGNADMTPRCTRGRST